MYNLKLTTDILKIISTTNHTNFHGKKNNRTQMKKIGKIIPYIIVLFWLVMMAILIRKIFVEKKTIIEREVNLAEIGKEWNDRDDWFIIFYNNRADGICENKIVRADAGYKITSEMILSLPISHFIADVTLIFKSNLGEKFELKDFDFSGNFAGVKISLKGTIEKRKVRYKYSDGSKEDKGYIDLNSDISLVDAIRPFILKNLNLEKGKVYTLPVSNPIQGLFRSNIGLNKSVIELKILDDEMITFQDKEVTATKVEFASDELKMYEWFDKEGNFLRGELLSGLYIETTTPEYIKSKYPNLMTKLSKLKEISRGEVPSPIIKGGVTPPLQLSNTTTLHKDL